MSLCDASQCFVVILLSHDDLELFLQVRDRSTLGLTEFQEFAFLFPLGDVLFAEVVSLGQESGEVGVVDGLDRLERVLLYLGHGSPFQVLFLDQGLDLFLFHENGLFEFCHLLFTPESNQSGVLGSLLYSSVLFHLLEVLTDLLHLVTATLGHLSLRLVHLLFHHLCRLRVLLRLHLLPRLLPLRVCHRLLLLLVPLGPLFRQ